MTGMNKRIYAYVLTLAGAAVGIAGVAGASFASAAADNDAPAICEVLSSKTGGSFALEAVYHADKSVQGTYQFSVQSVGGAGRTNINQGGGFAAHANQTVTLGKMTVGGGSAYDVSLTIDIGGATHTCGGRLSPTA